MADMIDTSTEAVKALMDGVTSGPWKVEREAEPEDEHPRHFVCHPLTECDATTVCNLEPSRAETEAQREANARFIAAARDLVPALLAERDDLRAQLDYANKRIEHAFERNDRQAQTIDELTTRADRAEAALAAAEVAPHDPAKVQALVEAASALERNLGINGVNVGSLRVNLFAALAAMKEG